MQLQRGRDRLTPELKIQLHEHPVWLCTAMHEKATTKACTDADNVEQEQDDLKKGHDPRTRHNNQTYDFSIM
eukprot:597509-Amphidinium_carterae.1